MKERAAIVVLFIYLFGATNAYQFLKFPLLVSHYVKHKKENPNTTLGAFFKMHYIDAQPFDADYAQDMQLPFKTTVDTFCRNSPIIVSILAAIEIKAPLPDPVVQPVLNVSVQPTLLTCKIFQPPRA